MHIPNVCTHKDKGKSKLKKKSMINLPKVSIFDLQIELLHIF